MDIKKETAKMIAGASKNLAQFIAQSSFEFWQRKDFRLYVDFNFLSQTERDRMFNELEVSLLGLYILNLRHQASITQDEKRLVIKAMEKDLSFAFLNLFVDLGIEDKFIKQWKQLINMRLKEYGGHLKIAFKELSNMAEFGKDQEILQSLARIQTITIDCLSHIRREKFEKGDPLFKLINKWLVVIDSKIAPIASL